MIKQLLNVEPSNIALLYLRTLDNELADVLKVSVNNTYRNLTVKYYFEIAKGHETNFYIIRSNASDSIKGSCDLSKEINNFLLSKKEEFGKFLDDNIHFNVVLQFQNRIKTTEKKNNDYGQSKQDELPYYVPIEPRYDFSQIVLSDHIKQQIEEAINIIQYKDLIYNKWGFYEVDTIPKSVLNFYGPPGTGKTMCAHAISKKLGKKLLALNYAEIESKYVGDAPKNLQRAFEIATKEDCVLFFDEADSFLGKRINNVSQGADQALNSLRSQMLILLEEHSGIVIFATNLVSNFDKAFESRILRHIKLELPIKEARMRIIQKMIPTKLPLEKPLTDEELEQLGQITDGFSGREIKNAILDTLLSKATKDKENAIFIFDDFKNSFELKRDELETLKKEIDGDKKQKILDAMSNGRVSGPAIDNSTNDSSDDSAKDIDNQ